MQARAERLAGVGVGQAHQGVLVSGQVSAPRVPVRVRRTWEDQGSIQRATPTGISRQHPVVRFTSRIGDGPHGRAGDRHGDFDFYRLHGLRGRTISASTEGSALDTVLGLYDAAGHLLVLSDDTGGTGGASSLDYPVTTPGSYYVMVGGYNDRGAVPRSPFRSGSGRGRGDEGGYRLQITRGRIDQDFYAVHLRSGDLLGGSLTGAATSVAVHRWDGVDLVGSQQDLSGEYPPSSPLPGGGSAFAYVAEETGWYAVSVADGPGRYRLLLETYPPGTRHTAAGAVQTVFLDVDGERLNTHVFGGPGVSTLSGLSRFLPRWGLRAADAPAVVRAVVATVRRDLRDTPRAVGLNPDLRVRILDSTRHADVFGRPNVSRVVVGGTMAQAGVETIGIAQSVDPGNYAHEESALVLLDSVSDPAGPPESFNTYLRPRSDRIAFVGRALGNLVAHEAGHLVGSFHTDNADARANLMDAGGAGFARLYGVGPDRVGGTADDTGVSFGEDRLLPDEGFTGLSDTLDTTAWAFVRGTGR